jgi:hypothetical protein
MAMANNVYTYCFKLAKKQKKREKEKRKKSSTAPDIDQSPAKVHHATGTRSTKQQLHAATAQNTVAGFAKRQKSF